MPLGQSASSSTPNDSRPKAFQFIEGRPASVEIRREEDKENVKEHVKSSSQTVVAPQSSPRKAWPSTPATRLPLADLIGDADEKFKTYDLFELSPQDQIIWQPIRSPQRSNPTQTPTTRKRARSSSPPSSSQRRISRHLNSNTLSGHGDISSSTHTPQIDPATALWNRYTTNSSTGAVIALAAAPFSAFLDKSSPQAGKEQAGTIGGLRRWTSCGVEFPTSKAKRRKVRNSTIREEIEEVFTDLPPSEDLEATRELKRSRIGSIIQRIQNTLNKPKEEDEEEEKAPSSSSPLPDRTDSAERDLVLPSRAPRDIQEEVIIEETAETLEAPAETIPTLHQDRVQSQSSGFGSDDLDFDILEIADNVNTTTNANRMNDIPALVPPIPPEKKETVESASQALRALEEFGDDDDFGDDLSMVDFENVASLYEAQPVSVMQQPTLARAETKDSIALNSMLDDFDDDFGDEFGDDDIDEASFVAAEAAATQSHASMGSSKPSSERAVQTIQRYRVTAVYDGEYTEKGQKRPEKVLAVEDEETKMSKAITLRQSWTDTRCTKGSYVHVIGQFSPTGQCVIDDAHNMLILHPDHLISALVVADSFGCIRRAVLQDRVKATSDASPPTVYGTMLHEIFQEALRANTWNNDALKSIIELIVSKHIEDIYQINLSVAHVTDHLLSKMPELQSWAELFIQASPKPNALVNDRNGKSVTMSVNKLLDVEEHVWSPMYGLKGNIDATVQVTMKDEHGTKTLTMPFELKTGKSTSNASHRAQTALYTLLLSDRYDVAIGYGILYYLENTEVTRIPAIRHELRHMIMQRNELACYVRERLSLPPMLKNSHMCNRCYAKDACFLYHKLVEDGDGETSGLKGKFDEVVRHLKPQHQDFFKKWDDLLTKEESEMMKFRRELWTMLSTQREKLGRCFGNIVLVPGSENEDDQGSKINRYRYSFRKAELQTGFSFTESQIITGEPIVISDEKGHYALAKGYVTSVQGNRIAVAVDRRLHNARTRLRGFDEETNQTFSGIMEVKGWRGSAAETQPDENSPPVRYRLDKDEFSNGMATVRNNLIQIMSDSVFHARHIRELVVEGVEPRFKVNSTAYTLSGPASQLNINGDQRAAIEKIMTAEDYALVLGMPGTGKTTTIAHIIRALVAKGKSVLLTSYTHTAVDNILLKIRDDKIGILRLGAVAKIHPEVREFAVLGAEPRETVEELQKAYHEPQVVATTCLGITHPLFNTRIFDYCIVDEASQITLPVCLGPIRMAKCFILVGDHYPLPPPVQNREAQEGGLDISLFKLLCDKHPSAVVKLRHQYRMNAAIMSISNALIYSGQLVCGSDSVASRVLTLPHPEALANLHRGDDDNPPTTTRISPCWLHTTLTSPDTTPVIFLNTDTLLPLSREKAQGARVTNQLEAELTADLVRAMLACGVTSDAIGVITLYRSQLALIKSLIPSSSHQNTGTQQQHIEAHTADRFQGRDKDVIILSCVRSNERDVVGDLLKDWRRVNVAVTRARRKLVIVGSRATLSRGDELLARLVGLCERRGWIRDLPSCAGMGDGRDAHVWDGAGAGAGTGLGLGDVVEVKQEQDQGQVPPTSSVEFVKEVPVSVSAPAPVTSARGGVKQQQQQQQQQQKLQLPRTALQPRTANTTPAAAAATPSITDKSTGAAGVRAPFKQPLRSGKVMSRDVLLGVNRGSNGRLSLSKAGGGGGGGGSGSGGGSCKRPILADIVNDVLGDDEEDYE